MKHKLKADALALATLTFGLILGGVRCVNRRHWRAVHRSLRRDNFRHEERRARAQLLRELRSSQFDDFPELMKIQANAIIRENLRCSR